MLYYLKKLWKYNIVWVKNKQWSVESITDHCLFSNILYSGIVSSDLKPPYSLWAIIMVPL